MVWMGSLGLWEVGAARIYGKSAQESCKIVSTSHRPPLPLTAEDTAGPHLCYTLSGPKAIVRPERLSL